MIDIGGPNHNQVVKQLIVELFVAATFAQVSHAQVYPPVFKSVEMQATIAPLGEMVTGDFFGRECIAAISETEKAIYFFEPDSLENLILTNVVSLPDTPIAISKGREIIIGGGGKVKRHSKLVVLMKPRNVALISFGEGGQPEVSEKVTVDPYSTGVRAADLETSGKLDMIAFGKFSLGISVEKNLGGGRFKPVQPMTGPLGNVPFSDIAFTDFNGDLVPDLAALDWVNRKLLIFYGRGDGTFAQPVSFTLKAEPSALSVADVNGNGYPDIVVGYTRLPQIDIFSGDGFGRFFLRQTIKTVAPVSKFAIADYSGDGTMDIAALSRSTKEIMIYVYNPMLKQFQYSGVIGSGDRYEDIVPFNFSKRIKADLVASSPEEKFIKVFKSAVFSGARPDVLLPVCAHAAFAAVCGDDTSNFLITGNMSGAITARFSSGTEAADARTSVSWLSEGTPASAHLLPGKSPYLLLSYSNADMLSLYRILPESKGVTELNAQTAFLPFAVNGDAVGDSASIIAAYRVQPDSTVGISSFSTIRGRNEFLEQDYSVDDTEQYVASAVTVSPTPSFLRLWRLSADSLELGCTALKSNGSSFVKLRASNARFINLPDSGSPLLALQGDDTLNLFNVNLGAISGLSLDSLCSLPLDSSYFRSVKVVPSSDSTYYLAYMNHKDNSVFLYATRNERLRFVKAWRVNEVPADIAISSNMKMIYFLNRSEAHVSLHNF